LSAQATKTALELIISSLNSLPVLIDEGALAGVGMISDLIFSVHSGAGKTRGKKDLTVDFKELKSNVFWTTETTDIDELRRTGAFRRMLYLVVKSWNDFTSLFRPEDRINEQYAGCGVDYIKYAIEHMEDIRKAFKEETYSFSSKYREITTIGLNLYAGLILLEKFYNAKFYELREAIDKVLDNAKALFIENKENVVQEFKDILVENTYKRFHVVNIDDVIGEKLANSNIWGEYDAESQTYYIMAKAFKEIAKIIGKERNLVVEELTKAGVLENKNVSYYMKSIKQTVKVYVVKFKEKKEDSKTTKEQADNKVEKKEDDNNDVVDF
jgi:hypothetical protein